MISKPKLLLVLPDSPDHRDDYAKALEPWFDVKPISFSELTYKKRSLVTLIISRALNCCRFKLAARYIRWDSQRFSDDMRKKIQEERFDCGVWVKPFLMNKSLLQTSFFQSKPWVYHQYDTERRFCTPKRIKDKLFSFDPEDCLRYKLKYWPRPSKNRLTPLPFAMLEQLGIKSQAKQSDFEVYFAGAFSWFRLTRLIAARLAFQRKGVRSSIYLVNEFFPNDSFMFFGISFTSTRQTQRKGKRTISLDIPQARQSGPADRESDDSICLGYSWDTPFWRRLAVGSPFTTYKSIIRAVNLIEIGYDNYHE